MLVTAVRARPVRSLTDLSVELRPGVNAMYGPNGVGKTNLLEALFFALTGRSFRTADRRHLIPFGEQVARAEAVVIDADGLEHTFAAAASRSEGRRHLLDGKPVEAAEAIRYRPHVLVFSPDRISIVKGPPAERRAHLDAFVGARLPRLADLRRRYGQALAQRNALLGRIAAGQSAAADLDDWDRTLAAAAEPLIAARADAATALAEPFAAVGRELGLPGEATIAYAPRASGEADAITAGLLERRQADLSGRRSTWGPHLDEVKIELDGRSLRSYGSQGQQRTALLALLFAEREVLQAARVTPLFLLDDVMSELDPERRESLGERLEAGGQTVITAADREALPQAAAAVAVALRDDGRGSEDG